MFILGPAGSGKTALTSAFGQYLEKQGFQPAYINLDAAVEDLPYTPDFDIRTYYTVSDIMRKYKVGPNLALIKSVEMLTQYEDHIRRFIEYASTSYDYIIVDTPGQLELTIFHDACIRIMRLFTGRSCAVFLMPADIIRSLRDAVFLRLMALAIRYRVDMPVITVLSKYDLNPEAEKYVQLDLPPEEIAKMLEHEHGQIDLVAQLLDIVRKLEKRQRLIRLSVMTGEGLEDLSTMVYEVFCTCGDLT